LPIDPKPIMTMGPVIFAWICEDDGLIEFGLRNMDFAVEQDQAVRRFAVTSISIFISGL
jgi:hypothetical protein